MKKSMLLVLLLMSSVTVHAAEEDWYTYWALGLADHDYPGSLDSLLDSVDSLPGVDRTEMGIDTFGFYWPQAENSLLGFVVSGSFDRFETPFVDAQINHYIYGVSGMKFFGREIGDGFFIRGDAGLAKIVVSSSFTSDVSDTGFGFLLGAGYAIPVSDESRILFSVNFSDKEVDNESWKAVTFNVGGLW